MIRYGRSSAKGCGVTDGCTATRASATTRTTVAASTRRAAALGVGSLFSTCADFEIGLDIDMNTRSRPSFPRPATPTRAMMMN